MLLLVLFGANIGYDRIVMKKKVIILGTLAVFVGVGGVYALTSFNHKDDISDVESSSSDTSQFSKSIKIVNPSLVDSNEGLTVSAAAVNTSSSTKSITVVLTVMDGEAVIGTKTVAINHLKPASKRQFTEIISHTSKSKTLTVQTKIIDVSEG